VKLISEKKELLEKCKSLVEEIKGAERKVSLMVKKENQSVNDMVEKERKAFRAGTDDRQQKVVNM
jgi:hypothetical protein